VIAGYTFRGAIRPDSSGDVFVFQAKDLVQAEPCEDVSDLTKISHESLRATNYLMKNDILLVARGMKSGAFRSTVFVSEALNVIASSSVHIIRITSQKALPCYVSHYLNSKRGQASLTQIVSGSYIGVLPRKKLLEEIKIPVPPLQTQQAIIKLYRNIKDQQKIVSRQNIIKQNILNETFRSLSEGLNNECI